jgi:1-acyl-sn-glycerol-3-phosphate acyltransferase
MKMVVRRLRQIALLGGYALALALCVAGSLAALLLLSFPAGRRRERWGRWIVFAVSRVHTRYLSGFRAVRSNLGTVAPLRDACGVIIVANHPTLLDAIMLFSELPQTFCLVKGAVWRNPLLSLLARAAGFVSNEAPGGIVEECLTRLKRGETLIIFPEGTRTVEGPINPLQPGFALIARRSGAPVQTILIGSKREFLAKRVPFLRVDCALPVVYEFRLGERFDPKAFRKAKEMAAVIDAYFRTALVT